MTADRIDLTLGLVGDDHVLSLFNIQDDATLKLKFQSIAPDEWVDAISFKVKNYGMVGDCAFDLVNKLDGKFLEQLSSLDYAILCIGTNDILLHTPLPDIVNQIKEILKNLSDIGTTPVFCTIIPISKPEFKDVVVDANSILTIHCAKQDIKVVDLNLIFNDGEDGLDPYFDIGDGIHLSREGYMFLADALLVRIQEIIIREYQEYYTQE